MSQGVASMPFRLLFMLGATAMVIAGCSRTPEGASSVMPLAPSPLTASAPDGGGGCAPPSSHFLHATRASTFVRNSRTSTAGMGRTPAEVYVDHEGDAAWIGEYYRYRVNGCDHDTAMNYVKLQIDTGIVAPVCAVSFFPETAIYPAREQSVDVRRQLGKKYQSMGRSSQSAVDADGIGIWMAGLLPLQEQRVRSRDRDTKSLDAGRRQPGP